MKSAYELYLEDFCSLCPKTKYCSKKGLDFIVCALDKLKNVDGMINEKKQQG